MAVLGLADPEDGDWARLRGLQYSSLAKVTQVRIFAHAIAALGVVRLCFGSIHIAALLGWVAVLGATLYYGARIDKTLGDADKRRMSRDEVNRQAVSSIVTALVWVAPIGVFPFFGDGSVRLELWAIAAMLMTASAVLLPAVPLGTDFLGRDMLILLLKGGAPTMAVRMPSGTSVPEMVRASVSTASR